MVKCKERPELLKGQPIGMYHCPECGEMLIAGCPHPDYDNVDYSELENETTHILYDPSDVEDLFKDIK